MTTGAPTRYIKPLIAFVLLAAAVLLFFHFRSAPQVNQEEGIPPEAQRQSFYTSRIFPTPLPTLPAPYLASPAPTASATVSPAPTPAPTGLLEGKYAWRFTEEAVFSEHTYSNSTVSVSWEMYRDETSYERPVTFFVADILVDDVKELRTAFAKGDYDLGGVKAMEAIAKANKCIVSISGDFARWHANGLIVRNGQVYRQKPITSDLCVLYSNGVMETYEAKTISPEEILANDPWQSWHFGPELLDHNGQPKTRFNTTVGGRNPRAVIGYYEPGHYCLVLVDGRQGKYSAGLNMKELSQLMYRLGCIRAYNLDGGATAHMAWGSKVINSPSKDRKVHDVICVCFPTEA